MARARLIALLLLPLAAGCGDEGRLVLTLELPREASLDPTRECRADTTGRRRCTGTDPRLSGFRLQVTSASGTVIHTAAFRATGEIAAGSVPAGEPLDLRLLATGSAGQVLGLGVARQVVVEPGQETPVTIRFRKPLAYVAGGGALVVLDTAAARREDVAMAPVTLRAIADVAAPLDGVRLLAATSDRRLVSLGTGDHKVRATIPLPAAAVRLAVSPDGRHALVAHATSLSVVALGAARPRAVSVGVGGAPLEAAFTRDGKYAWVLVGGVHRGAACGAQRSKLVRVRLEPPGALQAIQLGRPAADVAINPATGAMVVALPCGKTGLGDVNARGVGARLALPALYDVAISDADVVAVTAAPVKRQGEVRGQVALVDRTRRTFPSAADVAARTREFKLPQIQVLLRNSASPSGYLSWISVPESLEVHDVEISPDGRRALLLASLRYGSDLDFSTCAYRSTIRALGYLLVDVASGAVLTHRLTRLAFDRCSANCVVTGGGQTLADRTVCEAVFRAILNQQGTLARPEYDPLGAALLFGGG